MARGQLDEALRIRQEEELPVYQRLGDVRSLIVCRVKIAMALAQRGDAEEIAGHLVWAHREAKQRGLKETGQIEQIAEQLGVSLTS
ncbi:MAG: hypothetical protein ACI8UO_006366 [Verrucomicrobiales bacterium]|jgi:hypothetical protein